jgi:hypothetical protein
MKNKGSRMARNRSRIPLKRVDAGNQVEDSGVVKKTSIIDRPLGNRACCCFIGK